MEDRGQGAERDLIPRAPGKKGRSEKQEQRHRESGVSGRIENRMAGDRQHDVEGGRHERDRPQVAPALTDQIKRRQRQREGDRVGRGPEGVLEADQAADEGRLR